MIEEEKMRSWLKLCWYILLFIGLGCFTFFSIIAISEKFEQKGAWEATISVFSLLGVLLTAGGVFAGTVAILSYFSVKEKLDKAESELDKIRDIQQRYEFAENSIKGLEDYQVVARELNKNISKKDNDKYYLLAEKVLKSENPDYHIRIKANAILLEKEALNAYDSNKWEDAIKSYEELVELWRLLFLYNKSVNAKNYLSAIFKLAISFSRLNRNIYYNDINRLYGLFIEKGEEFYIGDIKIGKAYYNWGVNLNKEADRIKDENPDLAKIILYEAAEKYSSAIEKRKDYHKAYNNLGAVLSKIAKLHITSEPKKARVLFQNAKEKYICAIKIIPDYHKGYKNLEEVLDNEYELLEFSEKQNFWQYNKEIVTSLPYSNYKTSLLEYIDKKIQYVLSQEP